MLSLGVGELVVIGAVLIIVVGPERLPHMMRWLGRTYGQVRRAADDMRRAFVLEADRQDAEERYAKLAADRERLKRERDAARARAEEAEEAIAVAYEPELPPAREVPVPVEDAEQQPHE